MKKVYDISVQDSEKYLDHYIQESKTLSFQLDLISSQLSKEIEKKQKFDQIKQENEKVVQDLIGLNEEISFYESQKQRFLEQNFFLSNQQKEIHDLKHQIKQMEKQNKILKSSSTLSELYEELTSLRSQEESLKKQLKKDKRHINKYLNLSNSPEDYQSPQTDPILSTQAQKNKSLRSENFRSRRAWEVILSDASQKNHGIENEIFQLQSELNIRTRSCRKIKLNVRRKHNSP